MKTIEIVVSPTGETRLETKGFAGADCQTASAALEAALGVRQTETLTAGYHQTATTQRQDLRQ